MFGLGPVELGIIAVLAVLLLGPSQLPKLAKSIGSSIKEFKGAGRELQKAMSGDDDTDKKA